MKKTIVLLLFVIAAGFGKSVAQQAAAWINDKTDWVKIGEANVDLAKDRDEIAVTGNMHYAAVKLKITDATVDVQDMEIYYDNGTREDVSVKSPISAGKESRAIALKGMANHIRKIVFIYKTVPNKGEEKAHVEVWAARTSSDGKVKAGMDDKDTRKDNDRDGRMMGGRPAWVKLGEKQVDFKTDRDEILLPGGQRYNYIKFKVQDADINISDMEVYYDNDEKQDVNVASAFKAGEESRTVDLKGANRDIKKIVFIYKTLQNQEKEKANVEVWGMRAYNDVDRSHMTGEEQRRSNENRDVNYNTKPAVVKADDKGPSGKPAVVVSDKPGWHKIGETKVDFKKEEDAIAPIMSDRFAKIKIKVEEADVMMQDMKVYYEDGTMQDVTLRTSLKEGSESRDIDLKGGESSIKKVSFMYKTVPNSTKEKARVELWGLKTNTVK